MTNEKPHISIMRFIEDSIRDSKFNELNQYLQETDYSLLDLYSLVAIPRCTFRVKNFLPSWGYCLIKVKQEICNKGRDPNKLLVGLLPKNMQFCITTKTEVPNELI